jgi:DNA modification methylase
MTPFVADSDFTLYVGDVREVLAELPAESVHCVVTSPPYWGLRDYGTGLWEGGNPDCDHQADPKPARKFTNGRDEGVDDEYAGSNLRSWTTRDATVKDGGCPKRCGARRVDQQLGLEPTPELFVQAMVEVFREVRRVLRRDGTCWLNLGDSYARDYAGDPRSPDNTKGSTLGPKRDGLPGNSTHVGRYRGARTLGGMKPKDLCGIPWRVAFALQADGWYLRSDIIWSKPNPMPESVTDRPTKAHEYLFLLTREPRYFYDADAIREPTGNELSWDEWDERRKNWPTSIKNANGVLTGNSGDVKPDGGRSHPSGRNRRSVWEIATEPYPDAHFATFPQALVEPCVLAGTSERGCCPECGAPWTRKTERGSLTPTQLDRDHPRWRPNDFNWTADESVPRNDIERAGGWIPRVETLG